MKEKYVMKNQYGNQVKIDVSPQEFTDEVLEKVVNRFRERSDWDVYLWHVVTDIFVDKEEDSKSNEWRSNAEFFPKYSSDDLSKVFEILSSEADTLYEGVEDLVNPKYNEDGELVEGRVNYGSYENKKFQIVTKAEKFGVMYDGIEEDAKQALKSSLLGNWFGYIGIQGFYFNQAEQLIEKYNIPIKDVETIVNEVNEKYPLARHIQNASVTLAKSIGQKIPEIPSSEELYDFLDRMKEKFN